MRPSRLLSPVLVAGCVFGAVAAGEASSGGPSDPEPGVSRSLALRRAGALSDIRYALRFSIPASADEPILGRATIRFRRTEASDPLVLDFRQPADRVRSVRSDGREVAHRLVNGHIVIAAGDLAVGENALEIEFVAGDEALNRNPDYLYTLFVPDRASLAFPCFDQPDLKARWSLTVEAPAEWRVVANGSVAERTDLADRTVWTFAGTRPLSTYVFAFAAGEFRVETAERDGRRLVMYHRETDDEKVARNRDAIFDLHAAALAWLEDYTGVAYPFEKFAFLLVPSFQFGGMEHPGAIFYRARSLLLDESATQGQKLGRASLIAHETAHMWFGDLVTMEWFDDVWTKEVFANFMAAKIVNPSFPEIDHELRFFLAHHPGAYGVDRTGGAHPIRQELDNLGDAASLYGAIIYDKAPIVMKHLERLMGAAPFRGGLREYLRTYAYGNATWPDLIRILDRRTEDDLATWSRVWVEEAGRPEVTTELEVEDGRIARLSFAQADPAGRGRVWAQSIGAVLGRADTTRIVPVRLAGGRVDVPAVVGSPAPEYVLPNGGGVGYGLFRLDARSRAHLLRRLPALPTPLTRAVAWLSLRDAMLEGDVAPAALLRLGMDALATEDDELVVARIAGDLRRIYWRHLSAAGRERRAAELEAVFWDGVGRSSEASLKATYFGAYRAVASTPAAADRLTRIWRQEDSIPGLPLSERDYTALALELAVRSVPDAKGVLRRQLDRIGNADRRARLRFITPALSPDVDERRRFFDDLKDPANRAHEPWVLTALAYLHHPLRAETSVDLIRPALEMLEEVRRTGDIFFPKRWLDATLGGHGSPEAARIVRDFLDARPDYPPRLRAKILQSADPLFRAAALASARAQ